VPTSQFVDGAAREPTARDLAVVCLIPVVLGRVDAVRLPEVQPRRALSAATYSLRSMTVSPKTMVGNMSESSLALEPVSEPVEPLPEPEPLPVPEPLPEPSPGLVPGLWSGAGSGIGFGSGTVLGGGHRDGHHVAFHGAQIGPALDGVAA